MRNACGARTVTAGAWHSILAGESAIVERQPRRRGATTGVATFAVLLRLEEQYR
jgi:hypothetical protein